MNEISIALIDENKTKNLGAKIANFARAGDCFALFGDLGAGKTTFSRGFIQWFLQSDDEIPSPTFTLLQTYEIGDLNIYHYDLYRLENKDEIWELGWEEIGQNISLIEWPERAQIYLPKNRVEIKLEFIAASRIANISIFGNGEFTKFWHEALGKLAHEFV